LSHALSPLSLSHLISLHLLLLYLSSPAALKNQEQLILPKSQRRFSSHYLSNSIQCSPHHPPHSGRLIQSPLAMQFSILPLTYYSSLSQRLSFCLPPSSVAVNTTTPALAWFSLYDEQCLSFAVSALPFPLSHSLT